MFIISKRSAALYIVYIYQDNNRISQIQLAQVLSAYRNLFDIYRDRDDTGRK